MFHMFGSRSADQCDNRECRVHIMRRVSSGIMGQITPDTNSLVAGMRRGPSVNTPVVLRAHTQAESPAGAGFPIDELLDGAAVLVGVTGSAEPT